MLLNSTRKHNLFQVLTLVHQILHSVLVCNTHHILLYDGTGIQLCGNIVAGSSNNLHSRFKRSMLGLRSHKCRKERVMNVDYPIGISVYHLLGNDLHVARQHYESYLMLCQ